MYHEFLMTTHSMYSTVIKCSTVSTCNTMGTCSLQYREYFCLVLLFQHEKYSSQLQMSLKPSEMKKSDVDERTRGEKMQSTKSLAQGKNNTATVLAVKILCKEKVLLLYWPKHKQ